MYSVKEVIKTTVLVTCMFGFIGCGGDTCCDSPNNTILGLNPTDNVIEKGNLGGSKEEPQEPVPPVAVATVNEHDFNITVNPCEVVYFDSNNSVDPDGNVSNMSYTWSENKDILSEEKAFSYKFEDQGTYEVVLTVKDEQNLTSTDTILVTVKNFCK